MAKPLDDLPSLTSTGAMGMALGEALAPDADWGDLVEGSAIFS